MPTPLRDYVQDLTRDLAQEVANILDGEGWHLPQDCEHPNCADSSEVDALIEAIRSLHTQAHGDPSDSLEVENCHREPCKSVSL